MAFAQEAPAVSRHRSARVPRAALLAAAAGLVLLSAGCQTAPTGENLAMNDYRLRHPIVISEQAETFDIPVGVETRRLSRSMERAASDFAHEARRSGARHIEILVPSGSGNEAAAHSVAGQLRHALARSGIAPQNVSIRAYPVDDPAAIAPVRLAYPKVKAAVHACGRWTESLSNQFNNADHPDFGCATQSNLAAMVDDPVDLLRPREMGPADRARRDTVSEKYRAGTTPSGKYTEGVGAKVSDVGN
ncbi:pilus assembly protein CpaD [Breoghania corrubedonensis]|uniref:Pilus assembly protein CpaD n=1 Tax=Breoghania corrubedonensis TaxID=665038 RepID=A0A2T5VG39_9HYPH|nr:CpaD family pilus assembly protein [Breoghania corrubedonensis]PTW62710.1 pilus assembly protein CpaD [Breoghania corrubedonensis]